MAYRTPNIKLSLEPRVIRSIIESSGMDHATIAQRMGVDKARVDGWARTGAIEYPRVRALAKCVRRSETLFLRTVPLKSENMPDFRMMPDAPEWLDAGDLPTVRRVRYMQSAAREMTDAKGIAAGLRIPAGITVGSDAGEMAAMERARLAVDCRADGTPRGSADEIYRRLRAAIEGANILVFQYSLGTRGVRGLSLAGPSAPCAILVNSREIAPARSFTLLHEYGTSCWEGAASATSTALCAQARTREGWRNGATSLPPRFSCRRRRSPPRWRGSSRARTTPF